MVALTAGVGSVAHDVHYAVLALGLLGLTALLVPWPSASGTPRDEHARRVAALRSQLADGGAGGAGARPTLPGRAGRATSVAGDGRVARLWHPLAVVGTTAAAGAHAAVGPAHWHEGVALGLFFVVAAVAQLTGAAVLALRPSRTVLRIGLGGTVGLLALWLVSRTTGVPSAQSGPETVGWWDLTCVLWEVAAVIAGALALRDPEPLPRVLLPWRQWHAGVRALSGVSVATLVVLALSGVGS